MMTNKSKFNEYFSRRWGQLWILDQREILQMVLPKSIHVFGKGWTYRRRMLGKLFIWCLWEKFCQSMANKLCLIDHLREICKISHKMDFWEQNQRMFLVITLIPWLSVYMHWIFYSQLHNHVWLHVTFDLVHGSGTPVQHLLESLQWA